MNYIDDVVYELWDELPHCEMSLLEFYALLVLTTGANTTLENVHDAWAIWRCGTNSRHKDLVPFDRLTPEVQARDERYAEVIRKIALRRSEQAKTVPA